MSVRKTTSIFGFGETDCNNDADVIMTALIIGYTLKRLDEGKNCAFAAEAISGKAEPSTHLNLPQIIRGYGEFEKQAKEELKKYTDIRAQYAKNEFDAAQGWILLTNAISRINSIVVNSLRSPKSLGSEAMVDATPNFGEAGVIWIAGGTGDKSLTNQNRYIHSPIYSNRCGALLDMIEREKIHHLYKGRGAYTGFSARETGEPAIFSTFRGHPTDESGERWIAKELLPDTTFWGQIPSIKPGDLKDRDQEQEEKQEKEKEGEVFEQQVVGYTHGMIQAIYDVVQYIPDKSGPVDPGMPFEIGLKSTTKLASCFLCAVFMEATGFPASSVHLGGSESWAPAYFDESRLLQNAIVDCNARWASYCDEILNLGFVCIQKVELSTPGHIKSLAALQEYMNKNKRVQRSSANLILDASTVFDKLVVRVLRTLPALS